MLIVPVILYYFFLQHFVDWTLLLPLSKSFAFCWPCKNNKLVFTHLFFQKRFWNICWRTIIFFLVYVWADWVNVCKYPLLIEVYTVLTSMHLFANGLHKAVISCIPVKPVFLDQQVLRCQNISVTWVITWVWWLTPLPVGPRLFVRFPVDWLKCLQVWYNFLSLLTSISIVFFAFGIHIGT